MTDDQSPGSPGARRKRPPTVIDVKATDITPETPTEETLAPATSSETPNVEPAALPPDSTPSSSAPSDAFIPPPPATPQQAGSENKNSAQGPTESPGAEPQPERRAEQPSIASRLPWTHAAAGVAGGLLVLLLLWLSGLVMGGQDSSTNERLAGIEKQLSDLAGRGTPAAANPKAVEDLAARLSKIETAQASPRPPVTDPVVLGRVTATENAVKSTADNVASLSRRAEATDAAVRDANGAIEKFGVTLGEIQTTVKAAAAGSDRASRLAVAASALRGAVERGDPFTAELAIVKPLAPDAGTVAMLEPFASSGVPGSAALSQELAALVRPMLRASDETTRNAGFLDRLQANAEKLVRVRPVGEEAKGDDRLSILSRIEQRAKQGNIAGALDEIKKLPADARAPLEPWIGKAQARDRAIDASRKISADAVAALKAAP